MDFFVDENLSNLIKLDKPSVEDVSNKTDTGKTGGDMDHIFKAINANLSSELVDKTGAIFQFNLKGNSIFI